MSRKLEIELERRIATAAIRGLIDAGYTVSINNGEDETRPSLHLDELTAALAQTDEDTLIAHHEGQQVGWVLLIYGNNVEDVLSDYSTNLESALREASALAETYSE